MKFRAHRLAALAGALVASPLAAQEGGGKIEFAIQGETFVLDVPEGYCQPTGTEALIAKRFADADSSNLTPVNIQRCGTYGQDYVLIKTPRNMPPVPLSKPIFLQIMDSEMRKQNVMEEGLATGQKDIDKVTDGKLDVNFDGVSYIGTDDQCAYLSGTAKIAVEGGGEGTIAVGSCGTLVGSRHIFVHAYKHGDTREAVEDRVALSRAISLRVTKK